MGLMVMTPKRRLRRSVFASLFKLIVCTSNVTNKLVTRAHPRPGQGVVPSMSRWLAWGDKCQALASRAQRGATAPLGTGGSRPPGPTRASATGGAAWLPSRDAFQRAAISSARFHGQNPVTWGRAHRRNSRAEADSRAGTHARSERQLASERHSAGTRAGMKRTVMPVRRTFRDASAQRGQQGDC